jgi:hypothetical protein
MTAFFVDSSATISNIRKTAVGGLLIDATLAKTGVLVYAGGLRRFNPLQALVSALDSIKTAPVTYKHPAKFVDVHSYAKLAAGHVVGDPVIEDGHIKATLAIQDAGLIRAIEMGAAREISIGYMAAHDGKPGVTEDGESYDEARDTITVNHIAVVPAGRAGKTVRLMLDGAEIPELEANDMLTINGVVVEGEALQGAFDSYDATLQAQIVELKDSSAALQAQLDAAVASLAVATSDAAIDAAVEARLVAQKAADEAAAKLARVRAKYPTLSLDGRSQDFIDALDLRIEAEVTKDAEGLNKIESNDAGGEPIVDSKPAKVRKLSARERMIAELKSTPSEDNADASE